MPKNAYTFQQWLQATKGTDLEAALKGMSPSEQQAIYKTVMANDLAKPEHSNAGPGMPADSNSLQTSANILLDYTDRAIREYKAFQKKPTALGVPNAVAPTAAGKQAIASAQASKNAAPASQKQSGQAAVDNFLSGAGSGGWYPWMDSAAVDSNGHPLGLYGPDASSKTLSQDQQTQFREAWNAAHPDAQWADNASFMQSRTVVEGRSEAQAAFAAAFQTGNSETATYRYQQRVPANAHPGDIDRGTGTVTVEGGFAQQAGDALKGGVPALDKYMGNIVGAAQAAGVPWQVLWGVLRARLNSTPNQGSGIGLFNLDASTAGSASSPEDQIEYLAHQIKAGYNETGDWAFAALYTDSPQSALELFQTGHSSQGRTVQDGQYVGSVFGGSTAAGGQGTNSISLYQIGFGQSGQDASHTRTDLIQQQAGGSGVSGSGPTINLPDMNALTQQATQLIQQYLFRAPNPGEAEAMAASMRDSIVGAQQQVATGGLTPEQQIKEGMTPTGKLQDNPDTVADMTAQIQQGQDYRSLYAHKGGLTEADYAGQYKNVEQQMTGSNTDTNALREGMQGGNVDAFSGYLFGNSNSQTSFRQRLYQIAQGVAGV